MSFYKHHSPFLSVSLNHGSPDQFQNKSKSYSVIFIYHIAPNTPWNSQKLLGVWNHAHLPFFVVFCGYGHISLLKHRPNKGLLNTMWPLPHTFVLTNLCISFYLCEEVWFYLSVGSNNTITGAAAYWKFSFTRKCWLVLQNRWDIFHSN